MAEAPTAAVITVSTSAAAGRSEDVSGPLLARLLCDLGFVDAQVDVVPDDFAIIVNALQEHVTAGTNLLVTTGGTGMSRDDVTPEATASVIERDAPGFAEAIRAHAAKQLPTGILTRGRSGIAGETLIINLPGSPRAVEESLAVVGPALLHATNQLGRNSSRDSH